MTFSGYFVLRDKQKSQVKKVTLNPRDAKSLFKNPDFVAIYLFRVNSYRIGRRKIYSLALQHNQTKADLIRFTFDT